MTANPDQGQVLIVEDDQGCIDLITEVVSDMGLQAVVCDSAEEALKVLGKWAPRLVVLDVMLPDRDGFSVLQEMRAQPATAETPVLLCTAALFEVSEFYKPVSDSRTEIVLKPFHIETFIDAVRRLLEIARPA